MFTFAVIPSEVVTWSEATAHTSPKLWVNNEPCYHIDWFNCTDVCTTITCTWILKFEIYFSAFQLNGCRFHCARALKHWFLLVKKEKGKWSECACSSVLSMWRRNVSRWSKQRTSEMLKLISVADTKNKEINRFIAMSTQRMKTKQTYTSTCRWYAQHFILNCT